MRVLIIEDEEPASRKLIRLLRQIDPGIKIAEVLRSVEQATNWLHENPYPDLIFMDVELEDGICFEIFENCEITTPVIFTTAYDEYTLKAFKVNSIDYLLKPVSLAELKPAIERFNLYHKQTTGDAELDSVIRQLAPKKKARFLIRIGEHYRSVPTSNIDCFYIKERCNFILVDNGKSYPVDLSLEKIEQLLDPELFFRVSRNFIIHIQAIRDIVAYSAHRLKITLANWNEDEDILVSRERVTAFKHWMDR
jgi:DNA-binding LytR/AlgR family response regulator